MCVIGVNGVGKIILMWVFVGVYMFVDGVILFNGKNVICDCSFVWFWFGIFMFFEGCWLFLDMIVCENLMIVVENGWFGVWMVEVVFEVFF